MKDNTPRMSHARSKTAGDTPRRRGSVLVLSVVILVLMAMMGAAYLQMARLDRNTSRLADQRSQDYEGSILRWIGTRLAEDGVEREVGADPNNRTFRQFQERYDYPWTNPITRVNREESTDLLPGLQVENGIRSQGGGPNGADDIWLASIEPDFPPFGGLTRAVWPHISNTRGVFLDFTPPLVTDANGNGQYPRQFTSTADNDLQSGDTNLDFELFQADFENGPGVAADADGDGIADSKWTWAPLPVTRGRRYVMAVRIVDNSAMANLNVWQKLSGAAGVYPLAGADSGLPRWYWPSELDLYPTLTGNLPAAAAGAGETILDTLLADANGRNVGGFGPANRYDNWLKAGRFYDNPNDDNDDIARFSPIGADVEPGETVTAIGGTDNYALFRSRNEAELRFKNGLNRTSDNVNADSDADLEQIQTPAAKAAFFRSGQPETQYSDAGYAETAAGRQAFFQNEARKRLTLYSGAGEFGKVYVNPDTSGAGDSEDLAGDVANHFLNPRKGDASRYPPATAAMGVWANGTQFAQRLGAVLADFHDTDSTLTQTPGSQLFGMEYLPFVSEVYLQTRYATGTATVPLAGPTEQATFNHANGDFLVAIELVNPWPWPIDIPAVEIQVDGVNSPNGWGGDTLDNLLAGAATPINELAGHETVLIFQLDPDAAANTAFDTYVTANPMRGVEVTGQNWPTGGGTTTITLEAPTTGALVTYQEFEAPEIETTRQVNFVNGSNGADTAVDPSNLPTFAQQTATATADGLSILTVRANEVQGEIREFALYPNQTDGGGTPLPVGDTNDFGTPLYELDDTGTAPAGVTGETQFGVAEKGVTAPRSLDNSVFDSAVDLISGTTPTANNDEPFLIGNAGNLFRAGDLFRMVLLGPTTNDTVAEVWHDAADAMESSGIRGAKEFHLKDFMINPRDAFNQAGSLFTNYGSEPFPTPQWFSDLGNNRVTWGVRFLDLISTLDPNEDGLDNDNDSRIDDPDENLVPGKINLNTASRDLLARALPFGDPADSYDALPNNSAKKQIIDLIAKYRNPILFGRNPGSGLFDDSRGNGPSYAGENISGRDNPGIAWIGELLPDGAFGGVALGNPDNALTDRAFVEDAIADFNEYEPGYDTTIGAGPAGVGAAAHNADNFEGDAEEIFLALSALNQVASVRSDIFTAYIHVRAYPTDDFSDDPLEDYRIIATFDRSVIHDTRPLPKLRSVTVIRQP